MKKYHLDCIKYVSIVVFLFSECTVKAQVPIQKFFLNNQSSSTLTWDNTGANSKVDNGSGNWNIAQTNWTVNGGRTNGYWSNCRAAVFGGNTGVGPAGTVTLAIPTSTKGLYFKPAASGNFIITNNGIPANSISGCGPKIVLDVATGLSPVLNVVLAGTNAIQKQGSGKAILTEANTYTGTTYLSAGDIQLGNNGTSGNILNSSDIVSGAKTNLIFQRTDNISFRVPMSGSGNMIHAGIGETTINVANTFTGFTYLNAGKMYLDYSTATPIMSASSSLQFSGGTLQIDNLGSNTQAFSSTIINSGSTNKIIRGTNYTTGLLDLGTPLLNNGVLDISDLQSTPTWVKCDVLNAGALLGSSITSNNGTVIVGTDANGYLITSSLDDFSQGGTITSDATKSTRLIPTGVGGNVSGQPVYTSAGTTNRLGILNAYTATNGKAFIPLDIADGNTLRLSTNGGITSAAGTTLEVGKWNGTAIATGTGRLTSGGSTDNTAGILNINATNNINIYSPITDNGTGAVKVIKSGAGTLWLIGNNTYSGTTIVRAGALYMGSNTAIGTGNVTLGDVGSGTNAISLYKTLGSAFNSNIVVSAQGTGPVTISTTAGNFNDFGGTLTINRDVTLWDQSGDRLSFAGKVSGPGNITMQGSRVTLGNDFNDFTGMVTILSGTTYQHNSPKAIPAGVRVNILSGGVFRLLGNIPAQAGSIIGNGVIQINAVGGNQTLTFGLDNTTDANFAGIIQNGISVLSIKKEGTGRQILSGNNTYTGGTTINNGTITANSATALGTGAVTINNGGILILNANITNAITVNPGGTLTLNGRTTGTVTDNGGIINP